MIRFIADSVTSSLNTVKDDILNFFVLDNYNFVGEISTFRLSFNLQAHSRINSFTLDC